MRDPSSKTYMDGNYRYRIFNENDEALVFWKNINLLSRELTDLFVPIIHKEGNSFYSPILEPLTIPSEWTPRQLFIAAIHTLDVQEILNSYGFELKDASAWNIIFNKNKPFFCDHGSIVKLKTNQWWSFGQYIRNFIFPLIAFQIRNILPRDIFTIRRDGLSLNDLNKYNIKFYNSNLLAWPLFISKRSHTNNFEDVDKNLYPINKIQRNRSLIISYLRKLTIACEPKENIKTIWSDYEEKRDHYSKVDLSSKYNFIVESIRHIKDERINSIIDLGCNNGEYLNITINEIPSIKKIFGIDIDIVSLDNSRNRVDKLDTAQIDFDNITMPGGALGDEYSDIWSRVGKFDLVLMLAVIHHLHISSSIPLDLIFERLAKLTNEYLIFEAIYHNDVMASLLAKQRNRDINYMTKEWYTNEIKKKFQIISSSKVLNEEREIFLLKKCI